MRGPDGTAVRPFFFGVQPQGRGTAQRSLGIPERPSAATRAAPGGELETAQGLPRNASPAPCGVAPQGPSRH